jgi:hypothetical protein
MLGGCFEENLTICFQEKRGQGLVFVECTLDE